MNLPNLALIFVVIVAAISIIVYFIKKNKNAEIEEAIEVSKANRSNIMEELADVLEVVEASHNLSK